VTLRNASQSLTSADRRAQRIGIGLRHLAERSLSDISTRLPGTDSPQPRAATSNFGPYYQASRDAIVRRLLSVGSAPVSKPTIGPELVRCGWLAFADEVVRRWIDDTELR